MLLHGEVGVRDSRYRAMTLKDVEQSGADYLALGHVHAFSAACSRQGAPFWAYPGCPEGRGFDELGDKGFLTGDRGTGTGEAARSSPSPAAAIRWLTADVTGTDPLEALRRELPPAPGDGHLPHGAHRRDGGAAPAGPPCYDALSPDCF